MPRTRRRWLALTFAVSLAITAGCGGFGGDPASTTHDPQSGCISAEAVASVPANETVVDHASEAVADSGKLETTLQRAVKSNDTVRVALDGEEIDRAYAALDDVPEGDDAYYYIRYDGTVVAVVVPVAA